ncbi:MAG: cysteine-rich CWC family protein [Saprospiraceae bacterium]|nr:cysteine-rich CWC family protein [Saprospiraceae bacterium]
MPNKICPFCKETFRCSANEDAVCGCQGVELSFTTRLFLEKNFKDCLCNACLSHFESLTQRAAMYQFPRDAKDLLLNIHYTMEGGKMVFTELYHYQRGLCCGSGCRHCVYRFSK